MNLNPTMAQALAPWTPARKATFTAPPLPRGMVEFTYNHPGLAEDVICHLEYEPAERGSRERGIQMEPDYPASMTLHHAWLRGVDILGILSEDIVMEIEADALEGGEE